MIRYFPDAGYADEIEKRYAIELLIKSNSFQKSHEAIKMLKPFVGSLNEPQKLELIKAGYTNNQIYGIGTDLDVKEFFDEIIKDTKFPDEIISKLQRALSTYS